jgi:anti-anti-sigma factor
VDALDCCVTVTCNHHSAHVVLIGEFDLAEAAELARQLEPVVEDLPDVVLLNLGRVRFIGAATLRVLIELREACARASREFVITDQSPCVGRLFELAELTTYFDLVDVGLAPGR